MNIKLVKKNGSLGRLSTPLVLLQYLAFF